MFRENQLDPDPVIENLKRLRNDLAEKRDFLLGYVHDCQRRQGLPLTEFEDFDIEVREDDESDEYLEASNDEYYSQRVWGGSWSN